MSSLLSRTTEAVDRLEVLAGLGGNPLEASEELEILASSLHRIDITDSQQHSFRLLSVLPGAWNDNIRQLCKHLILSGAEPEYLADLFLDDLDEGWSGSWMSSLVNDLNDTDSLEIALWSEVPEALAFGMSDAGLPVDLILPLIHDHGHPLDMCVGLLEEIYVQTGQVSGPSMSFDGSEETARIFGVSPSELFESSILPPDDNWQSADF